MQRTRFLSTLLCLFALWLQMLTPALALQRHDGPSRWPICHSGAPEQQDRGGTPHQPLPACDHCVLCHAITGLPANEQPVFTRLDYPAASPLRWIVSQLRPRPSEARRGSPPRGPPTLD